ncbi:MAG: aryl-sulfate sulfotransferase [Owenweeksia sp.]|nr:aryl-sulfate sulfotransferase [Owenweeksia sp.]
MDAINSGGTPYASNVQMGDTKEPNFDWVWGQHAPMELPNGDILIFDNGFNRQFGNGGAYSRAVAYKVDETNMTVQQTWRYGENRGTETFSTIISDVDYLTQTGHYLFTPALLMYNGISICPHH